MHNSEKDIEQALNHLSALEPRATDAPRPAAPALAQARLVIERQEEERFVNRLGKIMMNQNRRYATAVVLFVFLFGAAFSFPAVRAAASDFLGLFRVQKFSAISISSEQIAVLERVAEEGLTPGELEIIEEPGELQLMDSLAAAQAGTGLAAVRTLAGLGEPAEIWISGGGSGRLIVDLAGARAIVEATGADPSLLPESLDGAQVNVELFAGVQQQWADGTMLMQTESPVVEYPDDLDPTVLGEALLQVLGLNDDEAYRLARSIDWTSTALLPVPQNFASFNEVVVNGVSGLALNSLDGEVSSLLWQKDGLVFVLVSPGTSTEGLLSLAGNLQ